MTPERWQEVKELFYAVLECEPADRAALLEGPCGGDPQLAMTVNRLLKEHDSADGFLELPPQLTDVADGPLPGQDLLPDRIGNYQIVGRLKEGGMGVVYRARQENPNRTVALKIIRPGLASPALLRRFEHEAQLLGRLQHPGIAQVFEAGTADTGLGPQPYFVMELVDGEPLDEFIAGRRLHPRQRLELFTRICDAVQHAHQKGVIHRDLKPANVLVDAGGQPKVLDFGVARATDADLQVSTLNTNLGQLLGTVPYMSPEQVSGDPDELDTRSDVYTLGVMGYEMLAGRLPYDVGRRTVPEAVRVIREEDPTPLSSFNRVFRGDLDTIFAKALDKDKARRYQSASDLAADVQRYLRDEPIVARRPTAAYQLRKFARRNRALVGGLTVGAATIVVALVLVSAALVRALRSDRLAAQRLETTQQEARKAHAINEFLQGMLASVNPGNARGSEVTVREILDKTAERIESGAFQDQPEVEAAVRHTIGCTYVGLGLYEAAEAQLLSSLAIRRRVAGQEHADTLQSMLELAALYTRQGRNGEAESLQEQTLNIQQRVLGQDHQDTLGSMNNLANLRASVGHYKEAALLDERTLEIRRRLLGEEHPDTLDSMNNLALRYYFLGRHREAEVLLKRVIEASPRVLGEEHPRTLNSRNNLAVLFIDLGRYDEAEPLYKQVLEISRRVLGEGHPSTLNPMLGLARLYCLQGRYDEAAPLYEGVLELSHRTLGGEHPTTLNALLGQASLYYRQSRYDEAERLYGRSLEISRRVFGEEHPSTLAALEGVATIHHLKQRYDDAEPLYAQMLRIHSRLLGEAAPSTLRIQRQLAAMYTAQARYDEAEPLSVGTLTIARRVFGDEHPTTISSMTNLANLYHKQGRYSEAASLYEQALVSSRRVQGERGPATLDIVNALAALYHAQGRYADTALLEMRDILRGPLGSTHARTVDSVRRLVSLCNTWGKPRKAVEYRAETEQRID